MVNSFASTVRFLCKFRSSVWDNWIIQVWWLHSFGWNRVEGNVFCFVTIIMAPWTERCLVAVLVHVTAASESPIGFWMLLWAFELGVREAFPSHHMHRRCWIMYFRCVHRWIRYHKLRRFKSQAFPQWRGCHQHTETKKLDVPHNLLSWEQSQVLGNWNFQG